MIKNCTFLILLVFSFSACTSEVNDDEKFQSTEVVEVDVDKAQKVEQPLLIRELFEDVSYIHPGSPEDFYLTDTKKILELGDNLIVLDKNKGLVVAYGKDGTFKGLIGEKGDGPQEYLFAEDINIHPSDQSVFIYSNNGQALLEFDNKLDFLQKNSVGLYATYFSILPSNGFAFYECYTGAIGLITVKSPEQDLVEHRGLVNSESELMPFDYTGFLRRDYFNWPLSSEIYQISLGEKDDRKVIIFRFPDQRPEEKKFQHQEYLDTKYTDPNNEILWSWELGEDAKEVIFYYGYRKAGRTAITTGFRLQSGQIFSHFNLIHGGPGEADEFLKMFFWSPYNIPTYSPQTGYYHVAATQEGWDNFHNEDKVNKLEMMRAIDPVLAKLLAEAADTDNPVIIRFKLKKEWKDEN